MPLSRRKFITNTAVTAATGIMSRRVDAAAADRDDHPKERPLIISTWVFGKPGNDAALKVLQSGRSVLDAVEEGIKVVEIDPDVKSVGLGGRPNSAGVIQLDACIMYGPGHKGGSVAALEGIRHPISVARRVMEKTKHVMLVGEGARQFALAEGFQQGLPNRKPSKQSEVKKEKNHDTISLLILGDDGTIAGGCSTSGLADKLPGRVGDSPILGSGLYVDNDIGAAGATGIGENVMRFCGSFVVVELMRQGMSPQEACVEVIRRIIKKEGRGPDLNINFVALDKQGRFGAAGTAKGFPFAVTTKSFSRIEQSVGVNG
jgi:N4-(beta-N-acetylglucosaminyl)-L-asparaginase